MTLPASKLYGAGVWVRNLMFKWGILRQRRFNVPVVVVGNLAVGGTGKTPHVEYILDLLKTLCALGPEWAVLTGVSLREGQTGAMARNRRTGEVVSCFTEHIPGNYHGTGDLFASVVAGALTRGLPLKKALRLAVDYVGETIRVTQTSGKPDSYGVEFEATLPVLIRQAEQLSALPLSDSRR